MGLVTEFVDVEWRVRFDAAIRECAETGEPFTVEHVLAKAGSPPDNKRNAIGARLFAAARKGLIERIGYDHSPKASRRAGVIAVWIGSDDADVIPVPAVGGGA
jgi:hypothetical protein